MDTLTTERLIIRPFTMDDLWEVHQMLDQDLQWSGPTFSLEQRRARLHREVTLAEWADTGKLYGYRAIIRKASAAPIGMCGFLPVYYSPEKQALFLPQLLGTEKGQTSDYAVSALEIGYALSSGYRGQGYATEAVNALLAYAFGTLKIERVYASTNRSNHGSIALMKRVGMRTASNPNHPKLEWPGAPGVLGVVENHLF